MATASIGKRPRKPADRSSALGLQAPSSHLEMPVRGEELTLPEIAAFLPRYLRSYDVCERVTKNGATRRPIANMIRYFRILPKPLTDATVAKMLQAAQWEIHGRVLESNSNWKIRDAARADLTQWDAGSLSTQGYYLNIERLGESHKKVDSIPFEDLALGVEFRPHGDDTLYLTRCLSHAVLHPGRYRWPQDFSPLIRITGGTVAKTPRHLDRAASARWAQPRTKPQLMVGSVTQQGHGAAIQGSSAGAENSSHPGIQAATDLRLEPRFSTNSQNPLQATSSTGTPSSTFVPSSRFPPIVSEDVEPNPAWIGESNSTIHSQNLVGDKRKADTSLDSYVSELHGLLQSPGNGESPNTSDLTTSHSQTKRLKNDSTGPEGGYNDDRGERATYRSAFDYDERIGHDLPNTYRPHTAFAIPFAEFTSPFGVPAGYDGSQTFGTNTVIPSLDLTKQNDTNAPAYLGADYPVFTSEDLDQLYVKCTDVYNARLLSSRSDPEDERPWDLIDPSLW